MVESSVVIHLRAGEDSIILMLKMIKHGCFLWIMKLNSILSKIKSNMRYTIIMVSCVHSEVAMIFVFKKEHIIGVIVIHIQVVRMSCLKGQFMNQSKHNHIQLDHINIKSKKLKFTKLFSRSENTIKSQEVKNQQSKRILMQRIKSMISSTYINYLTLL